MDNLAIGIDLGTTNSCVACYRNNQVEILENAEGERLTPSCVFFLNNPQQLPIVGRFAKKMSDTQPTNGIYEIKRFVGKRYNEIRDRLVYFSYNVESDANDNSFIAIQRKDKIEKQTPQEICSMILGKLKRDATDKLGQEIQNVVITVPAYFNSSQREATLAAAQNIGFNVLQLFNEPTAAALSFHFRNTIEPGSYSLVYDFGGGTFDVSILRANSDNIDIVGVDGDTNLGGKDFDNLIIDYVCSELQEKYDFNPKDDRRHMRRLQNFCEEAKKELSFTEFTVISLEGFVPNHSVASIDLEREYFETKAKHLFERTITIVSRCLEKCKISKNEIDEVILVGGSSRIPKVQQMLSDFFDGKSLNKTPKTDECVAEGAALRAAMLSNHPSQEIQMLEMKDVVSFSIGIGDLVDRMNFIIERNTPLPIESTKKIATALDQQQNITIDLYEGERLDVSKNYFLGTLTLENLTEAAPGDLEISVTLEIDRSGILKINAKEKYSDNVKELTLNYSKKLDKVIHDNTVSAEEDKEEDERFKEFAKRKLYLIQYCQAIETNLRMKNMEETYSEVSEWCGMTTVNAKNLKMSHSFILDDLINKARSKCEFLVRDYQFESMPEL